jgi:bifunctional non-homologous end joining protein LigD
MPAANALDVPFATMSSDVPLGDDWLHEVELEGLRVIAHRRGSSVTLVGSGGVPLVAELGGVVREILALEAEEVLLDGELIAIDGAGHASRDTAQAALRDGIAGELVVFDALYLDGWDLRGAPLAERKMLLRDLVPAGERLRMAEHVTGHGARFFAWACELGASGVVSKRVSARYPSAKKGDDWRVTKCPRGAVEAGR